MKKKPAEKKSFAVRTLKTKAYLATDGKLALFDSPAVAYSEAAAAGLKLEDIEAVPASASKPAPGQRVINGGGFEHFGGSPVLREKRGLVGVWSVGDGNAEVIVIGLAEGDDKLREVIEVIGAPTLVQADKLAASLDVLSCAASLCKSKLAVESVEDLMLVADVVEIVGTEAFRVKMNVGYRDRRFSLIENSSGKWIVAEPFSMMEPVAERLTFLGKRKFHDLEVGESVAVKYSRDGVEKNCKLTRTL